MHGWGLAVLRVAVGIIFVGHGARKLLGVWGGEGLEGTAAWLDSLGLAPAYPLALLVALLETAGGLLLLAGFHTRVVAATLILYMLAAVWLVHLPHGFFLSLTLAPGSGYAIEFGLALIAALLCLVLEGGGVLSVDARRARSAEAEAAGRARLRAGKV